MPPADPLATYRTKRDFARTPEPAGATVAVGSLPTGNRFVVQRHRARRLHYDFRLEIDGVLASWAVPKGPDARPAVRRAAFHVEDHPLEYFDFEGVIPAGRVRRRRRHRVGRRARGTATTSARVATRSRPWPDGELHVDLDGQKLQGSSSSSARGGRRAARRSGCCCTSTTSSRWTAGTPRSTRTRSCRGGPTTRSRPTRTGSGARTCRPPRPPSPCTRPRSSRSTRTSCARWTVSAPSGTWEVFGRELRVTNLDKVLFPPRGRREAGHEAGPGPVCGADRPDPACRTSRGAR